METSKPSSDSAAPPLDLAAWARAAEYSSDDGRAIAYWRGGDWDGDAPTLLLIHGFPTASFDWVNQWPALSARFRVLAIDLLGFGYSDKPRDEVYSILEQAAIVDRLCRRLGVTIEHVLAHDYGDTVAQELLARRLEDDAEAHFKTVCFLNGGLFPETHYPTFTQKLLAGPLGPVLSRALTRAAFARGLSQVFGANTQPSAEEIDDFWSLALANGGMRAIGHKLLGYIQERRALRVRWVGALIDTPTRLRLINGSDDPVSGAHMAARYRELVPNPDIVALAGIGHYPQWEAPQETLAAYLAFNPGAAPQSRPGAAEASTL